MWMADDLLIVLSFDYFLHPDFVLGSIWFGLISNPWWFTSNRMVASCVSMMTSSNGNFFRVTGPLCGEFTGPGEFPTQRPVTRSFDVFFDLRLNKPLSKQPWGWWFETLSRSLWRHRNERSGCPGGYDWNVSASYCQKNLQSETTFIIACIYCYFYKGINLH